MVKIVDFIANLDNNPLTLLPAGLRECEATLIPKKARPNQMTHLRPIATLPSMKKALGYRWAIAGYSTQASPSVAASRRDSCRDANLRKVYGLYAVSWS